MVFDGTANRLNDLSEAKLAVVSKDATQWSRSNL
jgi:hypothetical protein